MDEREFEKLVHEGIEAIPEQFLHLLDNVAIVIEDEPSYEQRQKMKLGTSHTLLGLYEGVPQSKRGVHYGGVLPDKITIFRKPIVEAARTPEGIRKAVKDTVWHEIAHHFGMSEEEVRRAERRRRPGNGSTG